MSVDQILRINLPEMRHKYILKVRIDISIHILTLCLYTCVCYEYRYLFMCDYICIMYANMHLYGHIPSPKRSYFPLPPRLWDY